MNPRVQSVKPNPDYTITLVFTNGEVKRFDVKPYLHIGIFQELKDISVFNSVKPLLGSVQWENGQDFCPDTLYMDSVPEMNLAQTVAGEKAVAWHPSPTTERNGSFTRRLQRGKTEWTCCHLKSVRFVVANLWRKR
jgi:hypothetical protein